MENSTTPQDSAAMPPASDGSASGEPVAWGIQLWGGDIHHEVFGTKEQAEREMYRGSPPGVCTARVVSLHLKPTLTAAEVLFLRRERDLMDADDEGDRKALEIVDGLLGRLGGWR